MIQKLRVRRLGIVQAAVTSANSLKLFTAHVFSVRRANPLSTPPGPSSQNSVAPAAAALRMQSSHSTEDTTCFTSAALIAAGSLIAWPVVLVKTVNFGDWK